MTNSEQQIDQLRRRLGWEAGGPLGQISTQATDTVVSILSAAVSWVRQSGEEHPLISIFLAFEVGFAIGRWGGRRA
jgi:hypothetical protein